MQRGLALVQQRLCETFELIVGGMTPARCLLLPFSKFSHWRAFLLSFCCLHAKSIRFDRPIRQDPKRLSAVTSTVLTSHLANRQLVMADHSVDASRIFNLDETGVSHGKDVTGITSKMPYAAQR